MAASELGAFSIILQEDHVETRAAHGKRDMAMEAQLARAAAAVDRQEERIVQQQYLRLAVVERAARYEMCGMATTVSLSGKSLVVADTDQAREPIRWRLRLWIASVLGLAGLAAVLWAALRGVSLYFARANLLLLLGCLAGVVSSIPAWGGILRALRPRRKLGRVASAELACGAASLAAFAAIALGWSLSRPDAVDVTGALADGDVPRARIVLDGLREVEGATPGVAAAEDDVSLAEAELLDGERRLEVLGAISTRKGPRATEADALIRAEHLAEVRLIAARAPDDAAVAIDRWFPGWRHDPEISEERARAFDVAGSACADDVCRAIAANEAIESASTPARLERASRARDVLLSAFAEREVTGEETLARLVRLRALADRARLSGEGLKGDDAIVSAAATAAAWASAERAKTPMIGHDSSIAAELLGAPATKESKVARIDVDGASVFLTLGAKEKVIGMYVVGASSDSRWLRGRVWSPEDFISQAVGRSVEIVPPAGTTTSRFKEGSLPVVVRWRGADVVELRIGDATP